MLCQFCKRDPNPIIVVPSRWKFGEASYVDACRECAIKEDLYCLKHNIPHIGFDGDDSSACPCCVEREVQATSNAEAEGLYLYLHQGLPRPGWLELSKAAELSGIITGDRNPVSVLRFVLTKAHRLHVPTKVIVDQVLQEGTASAILPTNLFG